MDRLNKRLFQLCTAQIFLESDMTAIANKKKNEVVNKIRILPCSCNWKNDHSKKIFLRIQIECIQISDRL